MVDVSQSAQAKTGFAQGATELYVTSGAVLNVSDGKIEFRNMSRGYIPLSILTARKNGTATAALPAALATGTVPLLGRVGTASGDRTGHVLTWAGGGSSGASAMIGWSVPVPPDWDTATGYQVTLLGERSSGNDTPVVTVHLTHNGTATADRGGAASGAPTSAPALWTFNAASGNGVVPSGVLNIGVEVNGNTSAAVRLYAAHVNYKRVN